MDRTEAMAFIDVLRKYYPRWSAGDDEIDEWTRRLFRFDYQRAKHALADLVFETKTRNIEPPNGKIMARLSSKAVAKTKAKEAKTRMTTYFIECVEPPERNERLLGASKGVFAAEEKDQCDPDYMLKVSETMRSMYEELYGGTWVIVQKEPGKPVAYGDEGRDLAFADILNGPDNLTRRWLVKYLEGRYPSMASAIDFKQVPAKVDVDKVRNKQRRALGFK